MSLRSKARAVALVMVLCLTPAGVFPKEAVAGHPSRIVQFYQDHLSGAAGGRCPMVPSCSAYAAQAIEKHGPVKGWIMAFDRVLRCGRSETSLAPQIRINGQSLTHDPVSVNDFWWFTPPPDRGEP